MHNREKVARILTNGGDHVSAQVEMSTLADGTIRFAATGPELPMWQHELYLRQADEILEALGVKDA